MAVEENAKNQRYMGFHGVSARNIVDLLMERYGKIRASDLEACRKALREPIDIDRPIDVYLQRVEDVIQFSMDRNMLFTSAQIVQMAYHVINKTGL